MEFDGEIKKINFFVEYVSNDDNNLYKYDDYEINKEGKVEEWFSTLGGINTKELAEKIREKIKKDNKLNAVVFYDPLTRIKDEEIDNSIEWPDYSSIFNMTEEERNKYLDQLDEIYAQITKSIRLKSCEMLLQQVTDFIEWLKKEKLLNEN